MAKQLFPELERRVAVLEDPSQQGADFDGASWLWLILLGIVGPLVLLIWGWSA